jgi:hypothetical protein
MLTPIKKNFSLSASATYSFRKSNQLTTYRSANASMLLFFNIANSKVQTNKLKTEFVI